MGLKLKSKGIKDGIIDPVYGKLSGQTVNGIPQVSIPLDWYDYPEGTRSFAIIMVDYDNYQEQGVCWLHWSVANIPVEINSLEENSSLHMKDIHQQIVQGKNSWICELPKECAECNRYGGPAAMDFDHEYEFTIYALDSLLPLEDGYYQNHFRKAIEGKVLAEATLTGKYII